MKRTLLLIQIFFAFSVFSQNEFPKTWVGNYQGSLLIHTTDSVARRIGMKLQIHPTQKDSVFSWTLIYQLKNTEDVRSYELCIIDEKNGKYVIDEKNSIQIEAYYKNSILTSFFEVMHTFIIATYTLTKQGNIVFEIISASSNPVSVTGSKIIKKDSVPEVKSFLVNGRQTALLYKQKN